MKLLRGLILMSTVLVLGTCAPVAEEPIQQEMVSTEADVAALRALVERFDVALTAGDAEALAALYALDAHRMSHESPAWHGRDAIRAGFARGFEEGAVGDVDNVVEEVIVLGDHAVLRGTYTETTTPEGGGDPVFRIGKWMSLVVRGPDGGWLTQWDIWNRDAAVEVQ